MRKQLLASLFILVAISVISCAAAQPQTGNRAQAPAVGIAPAAPPVPDASAKSLDQSSTLPSSGSVNAAAEERLIVRTVRLGLEVQDSEKSFNDISAIAAQYKGYVAQTNLTRDSKNRLVGSVTLRIPADSLDAAMKQIKAAGLKVLSENSNANDVTDQYTDLNARLKNLQATEDELRKMMDTVRERSTKADDVLAVYRELTNIRTQIEQIKGQMNVLDRTTSLTTVTIQLTPHEEIQVLEPETWAPNQTVAEALRALVRTVQGLVTLGLWGILYVIPLLLILILPLLALAYLVRYVARRRAKGKPASAPS